MVNTITHKKKKKSIYFKFIKKNIYLFIISFLIFILILLTNTLLIFYDNKFTTNQFKLNNAYYTIENVSLIDKEIREYLTFKKNNLTTNFLNEKEKKHLYDVKILFLLGMILSIILLISIIYSFFKLYKKIKTNNNKINKIYQKEINFKKFIKKLSNIFLISFFISLIFGLICYLLKNMFNFFFILFHKIFFFNDLWIMDINDKITLLYSNSFFLNSIIAIIFRTILILFSLSIIIYLFYYILFNLLSLNKYKK
ncbi:MAG: DUF1461 domain-containing protein [Candidatus Woesearchaeota archaeon]